MRTPTHAAVLQSDLPYEVGLVRSEEELQAILALQQQNHAVSITADEARSQGFVTVVHTLPLLRTMHAEMPSIIARSAGGLLGYALAMPRSARALVPVLEPMFEMLAALRFGSRPLSELRFYVMGQVCVAREARGQGVFDALYAEHRTHYAGQFDCMVTEVATRNTRSLRAHGRVGFEELHRYRDQTDEWVILAWDFGARSP